MKGIYKLKITNFKTKASYLAVEDVENVENLKGVQRQKGKVTKRFKGKLYN